MHTRLPKILIIDDEPRMVDVLTLTLEEAGFQIKTAYNGKDGLQMAYLEHPDLVLLDIMMPGMDGFQVLDHLRVITDIPVIMLTAIGHDTNRIRCLEKGAADIISKGTDYRVLIADIRNRLHAYEGRERAQGSRYIDEFLEIDVSRHMLRLHGMMVNLTPLQWKLLQALLEHEGKITKYKDLLVAGWDNPDFRDMRAVKVQISQLRDKLQDKARGSRYIHTIREEGYLFEVRV